MMPRIMILTLLLILSANTLWAADETRAAVELAPVTSKTLSASLSAYGVIDADPDRVTTLSLSHAALVERVWVRPGQRVKTGDKLLELSAAPEARMQYEQAQSSVTFAKRELARQERLLGEQLATRSQVDAARYALRNAEVSLATLRSQGLNQAKTVLHANVPGIVTLISVTQGQRVQPGAALMLIASQGRLVARLGVEPDDMNKITPGAPVFITPVFSHGEQISGRVREVHAMVDPATHLVDVLVPIPQDATNRLVLGSRVVARLQLSSHDALAVPRSAVLQDAAGNYVFTVQQGHAQRIPVETGFTQGDWVEIKSTLKAGDRVVVKGNYELTDGMAVRESPP